VAGLTEKIKIILDVTTDSASTSLKKFRADIIAADTTMGKFKAGGAAAFEGIKANAASFAIAGGAALGLFASKAIDAASDLEESANAVNVTFGESADGIHALGKAAADNVGLSNAAFNSMAVQFSSFAETVAGEGGDVVSVIDDISTRAADFASVMNLDVAEAARVFQSGLAGETEPLKKFGINLSAAEVEAYALRTGLIDVGETMSENIKVQARYGLLMEQTDKTAGDFKNTSDSLANSQRTLKANTTNLSAAIGQILVPALAEGTAGASDLSGALIDIKLPEFLSSQAKFNPLNALGNALDAGKRVVDDFLETLPGEREAKHAADFASTFTDAQETISDSIRGAKIEFDAAAAEVDKYATSQYSAQDAIDEAVEAQERQNEELDEQRDKFEAAADAVYSLHDAEYAAQRAIDEANEALTTEGGNLYEIRQKGEQAAQAIGKLADEQVVATGVTRDSAQGQRVWTEKMLESASTLSGPLQKEVLAYIARMNGVPEEKITDLMAQDNAEAALSDHLMRLGLIPREVTTRLRVTGQTVTRNGDSIGVRAIGNIAGVYHDGGVVPGPRGSDQLIVAAGGETILPTHKSGAAGLVGGATYNITVNAGMGANGPMVGSAVVNAIKAWERSNGTSWRS
jgi:hypothetical protein